MTEILSQADNEFQQGNFQLAAELYTKALAEESNGGEEFAGASANSLPLLLKLGDAEYAHGDMSAARKTYERIHAFYQENKPASKDEIALDLKLARCTDKVGDDEAAGIYFKSAYDLSKSGLSEKHFLRRTVSEAYLEWLRNSGKNAALLEAIEKELGIESKPEPSADQDAAEAEDAEGKPITAPTENKRESREQEYHVMRSTISKLKRKKVESAEARAEKSVLKKAEENKPTVDQKVGERKFLRKSQEEKDAQARTQGRSKLRSALSQKVERRDGVNEVEGAPADSPQEGMAPGVAAHDMSAAASQLSRTAGTFDGTSSGTDFSALDARDSAQSSTPYMPPLSVNLHDINFDPASLDKDGYALELQNADVVRAKVAAHRPGRRLEERTKKGVNLSEVPVSGSTVSEVSKVFIRQADAIKKASGETAEAVDVEQLREEKKISLPASRRIGKTVNVLPPLIGLVILSAIVYIAVSTFVAGAGKKGEVPAFVHKASNRSFLSTDGTLSIMVESQNATIKSTVGGEQKVHTYFYTGSIGDEIKLLFGGFKNAKFLTVAPEGLVTRDNVTLYAYDAPERKVLAYINQVAEDSQAVYFKTGSYPAYGNEIANSTYVNPFDKRVEPVEIVSTVDNNADDVRDTELDAGFQTGEPFKKEPALKPGAVHAISIIAHPHNSSDQTAYSWRTHCFYIRGCDRRGKLMPGGAAGTVFLVTLKNGTVRSDKGKAVAEAFLDRDICLCETEPSKTEMIAAKYLVPVGVVFLILLIVFRNQIMIQLSRTLDSARGQPS